MIRFIQKIFPRLPIFANAAEGTHAGSLTRQLEENVDTRYLLGKQGTAENEVAICGVNDSPLGVITDGGVAGENVSVSLLGNVESTVLMVASEAIAVGTNVYTAANGKVQLRPQLTAGTYYQVGRTLTASVGDNSLIEVEPTMPRKLIVITSRTGNTADDLINIQNTLEDAPDQLAIIPVL